MKKLLLFLFLVSSVVMAQAQSKGYDDNDTITYPKIQQPKLPIKERLHFGVSMGTSVSFSKGQDAVMGHFIAPTLSFQVSDKFRISGGVGIQYNSLNNPWTYGNTETGTNIMLVRPKVQSYMFARGEYALNPKLTLTGSVFASTSMVNVPGLNPQSYNLNTYGASGGFMYKINENSTIGAEVQIIRSNDPYQRHRPGGMMGGFDGPTNRFGMWY